MMIWTISMPMDLIAPEREEMKEQRKKKKWSIRYAPTAENMAAVKSLAEQLRVSLTTAKLLFTRGLTTAAQATVFLKLRTLAFSKYGELLASERYLPLANKVS